MPREHEKFVLFQDLLEAAIGIDDSVRRKPAVDAIKRAAGEKFVANYIDHIKQRRRAETSLYRSIQALDYKTLSPAFSGACSVSLNSITTTSTSSSWTSAFSPTKNNHTRQGGDILMDIDNRPTTTRFQKFFMKFNDAGGEDKYYQCESFDPDGAGLENIRLPFNFDKFNPQSALVRFYAEYDANDTIDDYEFFKYIALGEEYVDPESVSEFAHRKRNSNMFRGLSSTASGNSRSPSTDCPRKKITPISLKRHASTGIGSTTPISFRCSRKKFVASRAR